MIGYVAGCMQSGALVILTSWQQGPGRRTVFFRNGDRPSNHDSDDQSEAKHDIRVHQLFNFLVNYFSIFNNWIPVAMML